MSQVHDAEPNDIYIDEKGNVWRVTAVCNEPTVQMSLLEHENPYANKKIQTINGGVNGMMWDGFKRIYRGDKI